MAQRLSRSDGDEPGPSGNKPANSVSPAGRVNTKLTRKNSASKKKKERSHQKAKVMKIATYSSGITPNPIRKIVERVARWDDKHREQQRTLKAMEPVKQIDLKSYIGLTLKCLEKGDRHPDRHKGKKCRSRRNPHCESSSDSTGTTPDSSSSSDDTSSPKSKDLNETHLMSGSSSSDDSSSSSNSDDGSSTTSSSMNSNSSDGNDTHLYHRFVTEGTAYIEDGRVALKKRAFVLSHYLMGKVYKFYVHEVSGDPYKWRLSDFFMELFNYCFPINFHLQQREKLQACYQNSKTVKNYVYELNELWNMIGETDERAKVHKLWSGLHKELQRDLWREKLNPEISSLKRVIVSTEVLEITQSITGDYIPKSQRRQSKKQAVASAAASPEGPESSKREWRCHQRKCRDYELRKEVASTDARQSKGKHDGHLDKCKHDTPKLSKDEQERHKAEGLCYICHKPGHFSHNCPTRHTVSSLSKPPRVASFGIDVDFGNVECQWQLAKSLNDDTEVTANFIHPIGPTISDEDDDVPDLESIWSDDDSEDAGNRKGCEFTSTLVANFWVTAPQVPHSGTPWKSGVGSSILPEAEIGMPTPKFHRYHPRLSSSELSLLPLIVPKFCVNINLTYVYPEFRSHAASTLASPRSWKITQIIGKNSGYPSRSFPANLSPQSENPFLPTASTLRVPLYGTVYTRPVGRYPSFLLYFSVTTLHKRDVLGPADAITVETCLLRNPAFQLDSWYWFRKGEKAGMTKFDLCQMDRGQMWQAAPMGRPIEEAIETRLKTYSFLVLEGENQDRFACIAKDESTYEVYDYHMALCFKLLAYKLGSQEFDVTCWHVRRLFHACADLTRSDPTEDCDLGLACLFERDDDDLKGEWCEPGNVLCNMLHLHSNAIKSGNRLTLQRNAAIAKDFTCKVPKPLVVVVHVNGQPTRALIDTGSLADFMSVMLAEQLNVKKIPLEKPLTIQLAIQGL
ncbi:hypothetical protein BKA82DRAFT_4357359 [Pisolithus tinctorius]|nr:hypothetical protein BKA82DRAFT_4357359 [Pisolithus tinctorius]